MQQPLSAASPSFSAAGARRWLALRALRAAPVIAVLLVGALGGFAACSAGEGEKCVGGVIVDGVCQGKCEPSLCKEQNTCVNNQCKLLCSSHLGCEVTTQECLAATEDDTNADILTCQPKIKALGFGKGCPFGQAQCDTELVCPDGSACGPAACGGKPEQCTDQGSGAWACADGSPCCPEDQCAPLTCLGAGEGDADAYCSMKGCRDDVDCPGGFVCGVTREAEAICNTNKGNSNACGLSDEPCLDLATAGETYVEGPMCALRKTCRKRGPCDPCQTDLDCSLSEGMVCTDVGGSNRCARSCSTDADCEVDYSCLEGACKPRFGSCEGDGADAFCRPCQDDLDCGPNALCTPIAGLDKQRACLPWERPDPSQPTIIPSLPCTTDADCPLSPSGIMHGECLTEDDGYAPTDLGYGRCYFPFSLTAQRYGCWYQCDTGLFGFPPEPADPEVQCPTGQTCVEGLCK